MDAKNLELVSSSHATMALGCLSGMLEEEAAAKYMPDPPRLLELWRDAIEATRGEALRDFLDRARATVEMHRSVDDVTGEHERPATEAEQAFIVALAEAHYEAWGRVSGHAMLPFHGRPRASQDVAAMAELYRTGVVAPGPALPRELEFASGLRELTREDAARGAIEGLIEALDRRGLRLTARDVLAECIAEAMRELGDAERASDEVPR